MSRVRTVTTRAQAKRDTQQASQGTENPESLQLLDNTDTLNNQITVNKENITENYEAFLHSKELPTVNVIEITGDIFDVQPPISLAHCVSHDFKMSRGIALKMRRKFGQVT